MIVPLACRGIVTGAILSFAHTLGEFGVVLMVGGNIAGRDAHGLDLDLRPGAGARLRRGAGRRRSSCWCVSFVVLALTYALQRRVWAVWPIELTVASAASGWLRAFELDARACAFR